MSTREAIAQRARTLWRENGLTMAVIALLVVGYLSLRTRPSDVGSADVFLSSLGAGRPTVVKFYNNF